MMRSERTSSIGRLSKRSRAIIDFTARWRIGTNEVFHKHFFPGQKPGAVTRVTARLCDEGWLASLPLIYPRKYYLPARRTNQALGLPESRAYALGPQSLPTEYGILEYTTLGPILLKRLLPAEILTSFPWYAKKWLSAPHCLRQSDGGDAIELLRVDLGGPADHVARKCLADIDERRRFEDFKQAVQSGSFRIVVITATTHKAAALHTALDSHSWPSRLAIHISVIPSLLPLLPRNQ